MRAEAAHRVGGASVEMIEKYYAAHIKTSLDAAAINVMKPKKKVKSARRAPTDDEEI